MSTPDSSDSSKPKPMTPRPASHPDTQTTLRHYGPWIYAAIFVFIWIFNVPIIASAVKWFARIKGDCFLWPDSPGTFGDSYGALTSLFSLASFIAVLWAMREQKKDADKQIEILREELENSKHDNAIAALPFFAIEINLEDPAVCYCNVKNAAAQVYAVHFFSGDEMQFLGGSAALSPTSPSVHLKLDRLPSGEAPGLVIRYTLQNGLQLHEHMSLLPKATGIWTIYSERAVQIADLKSLSVSGRSRV